MNCHRANAQIAIQSKHTSLFSLQRWIWYCCRHNGINCKLTRAKRHTTAFVCAADFAIGDQLIYDCEERDQTYYFDKIVEFERARETRQTHPNRTWNSPKGIAYAFRALCCVAMWRVCVCARAMRCEWEWEREERSDVEFEFRLHLFYLFFCCCRSSYWIRVRTHLLATETTSKRIQKISRECGRETETSKAKLRLPLTHSHTMLSIANQ